MSKAHLYIWSGTLLVVLLVSLAGLFWSAWPERGLLSGLQISCRNVPGGDECEVR